MQSFYEINYKYAKVNLGLVVLLTLSCVFGFRVINVLKSNTERGAYAYVQIINFEMPIVKNTTYNHEDFIENKLSLKNVCLEALGLNNINPYKIINAEAACINITNYTKKLQNSQNAVSESGFTLGEDSIVKNEDNFESNDIDNLKKVLDETKPEVLIYHTHTTESYSEDKPDSFEEKYNVVGVGDILENELENIYGIATIHDKTNHSVSYLKCYERSNETVTRYLQKYGDFKLVIDIHRDSVDNKSAVTATVNGQSVAKVMYVNAKNSTRYSKNKELAEYFRNRTNELYPGMCRGDGIYTYNSGKNAFNQSLSDNSMLIEIGADSNTSEEAKNSIKCIARIIAEYVNKK